MDYSKKQKELDVIKWVDSEIKNHPLANDIKSYLKGARCTFPCYKCDSPCQFIEGVKLIRKI